MDFARLLDRTQRMVYAVHEKKQRRDQLEAAGVQVIDRAGDIRFLARTRSHSATGRGCTGREVRPLRRRPRAPIALPQRGARSDPQ